MNKYELCISYEDFDAAKESEYQRKLTRSSDDLDELLGILNKYINKFMNIKKGGWQYFKADIQNLTVSTYDLERNVYVVSLVKKGIGA